MSELLRDLAVIVFGGGLAVLVIGGILWQLQDQQDITATDPDAATIDDRVPPQVCRTCGAHIDGPNPDYVEPQPLSTGICEPCAQALLRAHYPGLANHPIELQNH